MTFKPAIFLLTATLAAAQQPFHVNKNLYPESANASADIAQAITLATKTHKNILLDFGGNWCGDCQLLDFYYQQPPNDMLLARAYITVHIDIGHIDRNLDIARRYQVPIAHGVPGLAILDSHGKLLYAQHEKEFEHTSPQAITALLTRYQPTPAPGMRN